MLAILQNALAIFGLVAAAVPLLWPLAAWLVRRAEQRINTHTTCRSARIIQHAHCLIIGEPVRFLSRQWGHLHGIRRECVSRSRPSTLDFRP